MLARNELGECPGFFHPSAGAPWLDVAWLPGPEERVGDSGSVEARLPVTGAHGPLHANITLSSLLTSSGGGGQRNLGHLHFEVGVNGNGDKCPSSKHLLASTSHVLICNCRWSICIPLC